MKRTPDWVGQRCSHPIIIQTLRDPRGAWGFEGGSPNLDGENRDIFVSALRSDLSLFSIEPGSMPVPKNRPDGLGVRPEACMPYREALSYGYSIKNNLPIVFVRTRKGEILPEARVALKYMLENRDEFSTVLDTIEHDSQKIFKTRCYEELLSTCPTLVKEVVQPYASISNSHMIMGLCAYVRTPAGVASLVNPPFNRPSPLPLHSGMIETEWFHSQLVLVFDCPEFTGRTLVISAGSVVGQLTFVTKSVTQNAEIMFSEEDYGADIAYRKKALEVGMQLARTQKGFCISEMTGVKSVSLSCPHCWVSVTAASETGVPQDHVERFDFYNAYKTLWTEYHRVTAPEHTKRSALRHRKRRREEAADR